MRWAPNLSWAVAVLIAACAGDDDGGIAPDGGAARDAGRLDSGAPARDAAAEDGGPTAQDAGPIVVDCEGEAPPARVVRVTTAEDLESAVRALAPGDELRVADGVYSLASPLAITVRATADRPVMIRAETVLGVEITGAAGFDVDGASHVTLCGFRLTHSTTAGGTFATGLVVRGSDHVRITRNHLRFAEVGYGHFLVITGDGSADNRVDHNTFDHHVEEGLFLAVYGPSGGMSQRDRIDHNYFVDHLFDGGEGGEAIRIGDSGRQLVPAFTLVENNLFERCSGDAEAISGKASDVTYRGNTFRQNRGSLTLRHGHRAVVEGNWFLDGENGLRFYGDGHRIVNNHFDGTTGSSARTTLAIGSGDARVGSVGHTGYDAVDDCVVAFNTLAFNATHLVVGYGGEAEPPRGCLIANNVIVGEGGTAVTEVVAGQSFTWMANMIGGGIAPGAIPSAGLASGDPMLTRDADGVLRLAAASPAVDAAAAIAAPPTDDQDGQPRAGPLDIGADERSDAPIARRPLTASDVGPLAP